MVKAAPVPFEGAPPCDELRTVTVSGMSSVSMATARHIAAGIVQLVLSVYTTRSSVWFPPLTRSS